MLTSRVKEVTRAFQHVSYGEVRIRNYLDDEDNFANFEETLIHGFLGCAKDVGGADWGITLQAQVCNSPSLKFSSFINRDIFMFQDKDPRKIESNRANCPTRKIKESYCTPIERPGCKLLDWQTKSKYFLLHSALAQSLNAIWFGGFFT